jgi:hypothetical protein
LSSFTFYFIFLICLLFTFYCVILNKMTIDAVGTALMKIYD